MDERTKHRWPIAILTLWLTGCGISEKMGRDAAQHIAGDKEFRKAATTFQKNAVLSSAKQSDKTSQGAGKVVNNHGDDVRLDATNDETYSDSVAKMMEGWGQAKILEFSMALGRLAAVDESMASTEGGMDIRRFDGMTANEIIAKADKITDEEIARAHSSRTGAK